MVEMFNEQYKRQELSKDYCEQSKEELEEKVRDLEQQTWAAKGATEDLGSATSVRKLNSDGQDSKARSTRYSPMKTLHFETSDVKPEGGVRNSVPVNRVPQSQNAVLAEDEDVWADDLD